MGTKSILIFIGCVMVAIALTVYLDKEAYPYAVETPEYSLNKWHTVSTEDGKWIFIGNDDRIIMYFCVKKNGVIGFGLKFEQPNLDENKPPKFKSRLCCWSDVDFISTETDGRGFLNNREWIWAIGRDKQLITTMLRDVLEHNEVKFQYYLQGGKVQETQFKFDSETVVRLFKWILDDPNFTIKYSE